MLGSNFRDDDAGPEPTVVVATSADNSEVVPDANESFDTGIKVTYLNALVLTGFSAHGTYWGDDDTSDQNALLKVVRGMYDGTPLTA